MSLQGHSGHLWALSFRVVRATYGSLTKPAFIWPQVALMTLKLNAQKCPCRDTPHQSLKACNYPPVVRTEQAFWMRVETSSKNWNMSTLAYGWEPSSTQKYIYCLCGGVSFILGHLLIMYSIVSVYLAALVSIHLPASLSLHVCQLVTSLRWWPWW